MQCSWSLTKTKKWGRIKSHELREKEHSKTKKETLHLSAKFWDGINKDSHKQSVLVGCTKWVWIFPGGSDHKASAYNAYHVGDWGSIPGSGRSPGEGNGNPLQYSCLENPMDGNLVGYSPWGHKESDTTEQLHFHFLSTKWVYHKSLKIKETCRDYNK